MAKHICKNCGVTFEDDLHTVYCDACKPLVRKTLYCIECGKPFEVGLGKNGQFLQTKVCPDCVKFRPKILICDTCGKEFKLYKNPPDYRHYPKRTSCYDCKPDTAINPVDYKTVKCATCGKLFTIPKSKKQINCDDCKDIKQEFKTLVCQRCGKEFTVGRSKSERGNFLIRKYCSKDCEKQSEKEVICEACGKPFTVYKYKDTDSFQKIKYCSDECRRKGREAKIKSTYQKKYGVNYYFNTQEYKNKVKDTCIEKYGVPYPCMTDNCKSAQGHIISELNNNFAKLLDNYGILYDMEYTLGAYSYDFHIKNTNILIEINPTFTHTCFDTGMYVNKSVNSHIDKQQFAWVNDMHCINIWQWDDYDKIISMIIDKTTLYARKLDIKTVSKIEANNFLVENHLQGSCYGNIVNLGLYLNNELVQIITFGKPRYNKNYEWELLRLCTQSGIKVVGGAERLFKHFVDDYKPDSIISYCDISKFKGDVYERLGFSLLRQTQPAKIWSKYRNYSKEYITDNLLRQRGFDQLIGSKLNPPEIYGKGTNNEELMLKHDWLPIYDCGQKVFEYRVKT